MTRIKEMARGLFAAAAIAVAAAVCGAPPTFKIAANRPDCLYACGEKTTFTVTAVDSNGVPVTAGTVDAVVDNFGPRRIGGRTVDLAKENPFQIGGTLKEPGFLRLRLSAKGGKPTVFGVGYEPVRIVKGSPSPADFDAFWSNAVARLDAEVPADPRLVLLPERSKGAFDFWRISFATWGGTRVYGYLSIPKDASATRKYPVRFQVPAAGEGGWTNNMNGAPDAICMLITVHWFEPPFDLGELKAKHEELRRELKAKYGNPSYSRAGIDKSREEYYFYRAIVGINRAVEWLAARPEVDLTDFTYSGTSQGGGFGFYLLGLSSRFTKGVMYVPAITDTMGYLKGRQSGWPQIVEGQTSPEARAAAEANAPYFDGANFASRITCPVRMVVGFADTTCAPCAVYAAFNALASRDKDIRHGIGMGHNCDWKFYQEFSAWQKERNPEP